jgi:thiosulfate/3-mercaptopyruvate sulfurtransferase
MTDTALVGTDWLAARLRDPGLRILDIRSAVDGGARPAYEAAHVPGAVHTDYAKEGWRATKGMATGMLPDADFLSQLFGRLGIAPDSHVVIVSAGTSAGDFCAAARVYWTFKTAGHGSVSILDGGMAAWVKAGRPVESGAGTTPAPAHHPVAIDPTWHADLGAVARAVATGTALPLDTRSASYFEGKEKSPQAKRAGRIPGALHHDHVAGFDKEAGRLKPAAELAKLFAGIPNRPVMSYCNTGHQAALSWFVLSEILRRPGVTLYDGSMSEWTEDEEREVAVGPPAV